MRMNWEKLLCCKRVADYKAENDFNISQYCDPRSPFERDVDQLSFSYPFRRLQDKTQVIPFPQYDFVHTRLTHSLEVSSVGRSFGKMAAELIFKELNTDFVCKLNICKSDIGALLSAACLAHDIGNPPFGHSGEDAISYYFNNIDNNFNPESIHSDFEINGDEIGVLLESVEVQNLPFCENKPLMDFISKVKKWNDLINFEGNANGFRILTQKCDKGINPTLALLGVFTKYPRESWLFSNPFKGLSKDNKPKSQTKHGFFQEQKDLFQFVANELGLIKIEGVADFDIAFCRHPLAFLMEASDDIAYQMIDFEDGCRLGLIDFEKKYEKIKLRNRNNIFKEIIINKTPKEILIEIAEVDKSFNYDMLSDSFDFKDSISYIRSKVINVLIHECFKVFKDKYEEIMHGKFDKALIDCIENNMIQKNLKIMKSLIQKYVYNHKSVLESEASGYEVIEFLIKSFAITSKICYTCGEEETSKDKKFKSLIPDEYLPSNEKETANLSQEEKYERVLKILDYISGMTDKYAISLYRKIKGIQLPG